MKDFSNQTVCCYSLCITDNCGYEMYYKVRMALLPKFIKRFVVDGRIMILYGIVHVKVRCSERFFYIETLPF